MSGGSRGGAREYPMGMMLIQRGACPLEAVSPIACWFCQYGHATECHHPMTCDEAKCSHYAPEVEAS